MKSDTGAEKPKIILDCDPGLDDAIAILTAAHFCELVGITTVAGNVGIDHTTQNALAVAQIAGLDIPIHRGTSKPLISPPVEAAHVHGATGLGDARLPDLTRTTASDDAVGFICDTARSVDSLHLVAVGPLTNLALALRRDPDLPRHLSGITVMGGSSDIGNVTSVAEFNTWTDPEAASIMFSEAAPITMVGLNVTHQVLLGMDVAHRVRAAGTSAARFAADLLSYAYNSALRRGLPAAPVHDAVAVVTVTHPHLFTISRHPVTVELRGEHTRGMTIVDLRPDDRTADPGNRTPDPSTAESPQPNDVVWGAQAEAVINLIVEASTSF